MYDDAPSFEKHRANSHHSDPDRNDWRHHRRPHTHALTLGAIDPSRLGPAPGGFWYRCDSPAGYYPYIPACQTPWRLVPSMPPR